MHTRTIARNVLAAHLWVAAASAIGFAQAPVPTDAEAPLQTHAFSLPDTRLVRALYDSAEEHVAARRWREALADYQKILEDHAGDLLPARHRGLRAGTARARRRPPRLARYRDGHRRMPDNPARSVEP